jgi:hypothetical protein
LEKPKVKESACEVLRREVMGVEMEASLETFMWDDESFGHEVWDLFLLN